MEKEISSNSRGRENRTPAISDPQSDAIPLGDTPSDYAPYSPGTTASVLVLTLISIRVFFRTGERVEFLPERRDPAHIHMQGRYGQPLRFERFPT